MGRCEAHSPHRPSRPAEGQGHGRSPPDAPYYCNHRARFDLLVRERIVPRRARAGAREIATAVSRYEQPEVEPQETHFRQEPLRTIVMEPHSGHWSPS